MYSKPELFLVYPLVNTEQAKTSMLYSIAYDAITTAITQLQPIVKLDSHQSFLIGAMTALLDNKLIERVDKQVKSELVSLSVCLDVEHNLVEFYLSVAEKNYDFTEVVHLTTLEASIDKPKLMENPQLFRGLTTVGFPVKIEIAQDLVELLVGYFLHNPTFSTYKFLSTNNRWLTTQYVELLHHFTKLVNQISINEFKYLINHNPVLSLAYKQTACGELTVFDTIIKCTSDEGYRHCVYRGHLKFLDPNTRELFEPLGSIQA